MHNFDQKNVLIVLRIGFLNISTKTRFPLSIDKIKDAFYRGVRTHTPLIFVIPYLI